MNLRIFAACIVVVACTLCGRSITAAMSRRIRMIRELTASLRLLRIRMTHQSETLASALEACGSALFTEVAELLSDQCDPYGAWTCVVKSNSRRGGQADCLGKQEIGALNELFGVIGSSGRVRQDCAIRSCIAQLESIEQIAGKHLSETSRLYGSLCILLGLSIAVLLI